MKNILFILVLLVLLALIAISSNLNEILAGVAILLIGVRFMEVGFKYVSGGPVERLLKKSTSSVFRSFGFGIISTSIVQSSGLISLLSISFISAGLVSLTAGIGIIFGANIGTTTGAWLISIFGLNFKVSAFALPFITIGGILILRKEEKYKGVGNIFVGIGFIFLGIHFMKEGFEAYQDTIQITRYSMTGFTGVLVYVLIGIVATVIMQSSHATLALLLTALSFNQITYMNALAMAIGSNIGTTIVAVIGSIGTNAAGKRLAAAHVIFNLTTGLAAIFLIYQLGWLVDKISLYVGIRNDNYTLKLAMFHSLFNVLGVLFMWPFITQIEKFISRIIKDDSTADITMPKYLNKSSIKYIETAIPALIKESRHLFDNAFEIIAHGLNIHRGDILSNKKLKELIPDSVENMRINIDELYFKKIKTVYSKIIKYSTIIQSYKISEEEAHLINQIRIANRYLIEIIKHIRNLQLNMTIYIVSSNREIRNEYNYLRLKIAKVMREIYRIETTEDIESQHEKLLVLQQKAKMHDVLVNGKLDKLIRERLITSKMATSLMNDSALVARICEKLITVAELIYINADTILEREAEIHDTETADDFLDEAD